MIRSIAKILFFIFGLFGIYTFSGYAFSAFMDFVVTPWACIDTPMSGINGLIGYDFDIIYTNCDTIAKEEWISVYAARHGARRRTLLFEFVPGWADVPPSITAVDQRTLRIAIPKLSSVHLRRTRWDGLIIEYDIGHIDYPNAHGDPDH